MDSIHSTSYQAQALSTPDQSTPAVSSLSVGGNPVTQSVAAKVRVGNTLLQARETTVALTYGDLMTQLMIIAQNNKGFYLINHNESHYPHPAFLFGLANTPSLKKNLPVIREAIQHILNDKSLQQDVRWLAVFVGICSSKSLASAASLLSAYNGSQDWDAYFADCSDLNKFLLKQLMIDKGSITPFAEVYNQRIANPNTASSSSNEAVEETLISPPEPQPASGLEQLQAAYAQGAIFWDGDFEICISHEDELNQLLDESGDIRKNITVSYDSNIAIDQVTVINPEDLLKAARAAGVSDDAIQASGYFSFWGSLQGFLDLFSTLGTMASHAAASVSTGISTAASYLNPFGWWGSSSSSN